ncbi:MAG: MBL fold metallo-hydrolase [Candidatus Omnitrophota bacterium]
MRRIPARYCTIIVLSVALLSVCFIGDSLSIEEKVYIHFIDVGYADAILIEIPGEGSILVDTGSEEYSDKLTTYLKNVGVKELHTLILTHPHKNHFGGISSVMEDFKVHRFFHNGDTGRAEEGYSELIKWINRRGLYGIVLRRGYDVKTSLKTLKIKVLNPEALLGDANENSIALYVKYKDTSFFLTGDIDTKQQDEIINKFPGLEAVDLVQVPHHGGKVSKKFSEFFKDKIFIISTGENKWGAPSQEDLDKLHGKVLRTDKKGNIIVESDGEKVRIFNE